MEVVGHRLRAETIRPDGVTIRSQMVKKFESYHFLGICLLTTSCFKVGGWYVKGEVLCQDQATTLNQATQKYIGQLTGTLFILNTFFLS